MAALRLPGPASPPPPVLDLGDLDHLALIASDVAPQV